MKYVRRTPSRRAHHARLVLVLSLLSGSASVSSLAGDNSSMQPPMPAFSSKIEMPGIKLKPITTPSFGMPNAGADSSGAAVPDFDDDAFRKMYEKRVQDFTSDPDSHQAHSDRIAYADALIHLGHYDKAIDELRQIEVKYPGAYINASLLGLANELSGNLESAKRWVAESIERSPSASEGTEWLHLAIIQAHIEIAANPKWLESHSVLDGHEDKSDEEIVHAIDFQVGERKDLFVTHDDALSDLFYQAAIRAKAVDSRDDYFAQSIQSGELRRKEIDGMKSVRAQVHAVSQAN